MQRVTRRKAYILDPPYYPHYVHGQSPVTMNYVARRNGAEGRPVAEPFTYCELACGPGLTSATLAAALPHGEFHAMDINPAHIRYGRQLAEQSGLTNLSFTKASFAGYLNADLPKFDYISCHGAYSWISKKIRRDIGKVIEKFLKPGGLVYIAHIALPGWAPYLPIRQMMQEFTADVPGGPEARAKAGVAHLKFLLDNDAPFALSSSRVQRKIGRMSRNNTVYLAHEYLNEHFQPQYFSEVAAEMARLGLAFCGAANIREYSAGRDGLEKFQAFLDAKRDPVARESARSLIRNEFSRNDVYRKGAGRDDGADPAATLGGTIFGNARTRRLHKTKSRLKLPSGGSAPLEAISFGDRSLDEILTMPELKAPPSGEVVTAISHLVEDGWLRPLASRARRVEAAEAAHFRIIAPFNRVILEEFLLDEGRCYLASPVTGDGIRIDLASGLLLLAAESVGLDRAIADVEAALDRSGKYLKRDDKSVKDPSKRRQLLEEEFDSFRSKLIPTLLRLGLIEAD